MTTPHPLDNVERIAIHTSDGLGLRAELLDTGSASGHPPRALAVICHPHPLHGGNMHNHVVSGLFGTFAALGVPTIRFNFRGTSGSEGRHGGGVDERLDVIAAIDAITGRYATSEVAEEDAPDRSTPIVLAGYSFGALVALTVDHRAVSGWFAIAPPLSMATDARPEAATDDRPVVIVTGTVDDFTTASDTERLTAAWTATEVIPLPGEDHFLATASKNIRVEAEKFLTALAGS